MTVSVLEKYDTMAPVETDASPEANATDESEVRPFGWMRGVRDRAIMLLLRMRDGNILALAYSRLDCAAYDPTEGITLQFGGETVRIKGRNLNAEVHPSVRMFEGITRHRISFVQESDTTTPESDQGIFIESIDTSLPG